MNTRIMGSLLLLLLLVEGQQQLANAIRVEECQSAVDLFSLPRRFQPMNYLMDLWLTPGNEKYEGTVYIKLDIKKHRDSVDFLKSRTISGNLPPYVRDRRNIILNAHGLTVEDVKFEQDRYIRNPECVCHDAQHGILVITLMKVPIAEMPATLYIKFSGEAKSAAMGLRTSVTEETNRMISSHFKPASARRAFPCFDDPEFKATVELIIHHPPLSTALSNIRGRRYPKTNTLVTTIFKKTPKIPIYQLSIVVGEFHTIQDTSESRKTLISIYTYKYLCNDARDMLNKAKLAYDWASNFFASPPHSLRKLDIVVLNWESTEVENFGLITMSLDSMKGNEQKANLHDSNGAITVLLRAMTHQWLSYVRMGWWNDLWLKEGVVAYLANEMAAQFYHETCSELYTLVETTMSMIYNKEPEQSHFIIDKEYKRPEEFVASFDSLSHKKSEAIVRMFAGFVGKDNFNSAIRGLIQSGAGEQPVEIDELWERLLIYAPEHGNMKEVARKWALNRGNPTLYFNLDGFTTVTVSQLQELAGGQEWPVPIKYEQHITDSRTETLKFVLSSVEETFELPEPINFYDINQWLTFNPEGQAYYRVLNWPEALLVVRGRALISGRLSPVQRLQLLSDYYSLIMVTGKTDHFVELFKLFSNETDDGVMLLLVNLLSSITLTEASVGLVNGLMINYYLVNCKLSWEGDDNLLNQHVRGQVVYYLAVILQNLTVISDLQEYMRDFGQLPSFLEFSLEPLFFEYLGLWISDSG